MPEAPPAEPPDHVSVASILDSIEKNRLEYSKLEWEHKIAELNATSDERKEEREYQRKLKSEERERKRKAAEHAREVRAAGGNPRRGPKAVPAMRDCEDCMAKVEGRNRHHTRDMYRHAKEQHELFFAGGQSGAAN